MYMAVLALNSAVRLLYSQNIGSVAAFPIAPYLSDEIGRRRTIFIGAVIMVGAAALQAAAQSIGMFIGARSVSCMKCIDASLILVL
jgi:MFS family permease